MAEQIPANSPEPNESRLLPLIIAGSVCFVLAIVFGYGSWYLFGTNSPMRKKHENAEAQIKSEVSKPPETQTTPNSEIIQTPTPQATPETVKADFPLPTVKVEAGEVVLGGEDTEKPIRRVFVEDFEIGETEVTNAQYAEFVRETKKHIPTNWKNSDFPKNEAEFPVTNISWQDAKAYCIWLSEKSHAKVSLPTEAEWQLAARGKENYKYPWGDKWNERAALSKEKNGNISAVKSFAANKSPFGAFDMAGNVWEWVADSVKIEDLPNDDKKSAKEKEEAIKSGKTLRLIKGGSAQEPAKNISATASEELPEDSKFPVLGFRIAVHHNELKNDESSAK